MANAVQLSLDDMSFGSEEGRRSVVVNAVDIRVRHANWSREQGAQ
jgi:hypothetical protein